MSGEFDYQRIVFGRGWALDRDDRNLGGLRLDRALRALEARPETLAGRILEAGCGVGRFTAPLAAHLPRARIAAFDLSAAALSEAARSTEAGGGRVAAGYTAANALALPYAAAAFDALLFFDLLEHLSRPEVALAEFARVVRPGGLLHGYVPCEGQRPTLHAMLGRWVHRWTARHAGHVQHFRHAEVIDWVGAAGFRVVQADYSYHLLGQALDVATFAAREAIFRRQAARANGHMGSADRPAGADRPAAYYDRSVIENRGAVTVYDAVRRGVERGAYAEARVLARCPWALGLHITAERP